MTAFDSKPRIQRAITLLIKEGLTPRVVESVSRRLGPGGVTIVDSLLDAIHLTGTTTVDSPISAVILGKETPFEGRDVVNAFRTMDPAVRLIMITEGEVEDESGRSRAEAEGFSAVLAAPGEVEQLDQLIGIGSRDDSRDEHQPISMQTAEPPVVTRSPEDDDRPDSEPDPGVERVLERSKHQLEQQRMTRQVADDAAPPPLPGTPQERDMRLLSVMMTGQGVLECALDILQQEVTTGPLSYIGGEPSLQEEIAELEEPQREGRALPVNVGGRVLGNLIHESSSDRPRLELWNEWLGHWLMLSGQFEQLEQMAWTDHLTGAGNRRALERILDTVLERAREEMAAVTVMCFDIDDFKQYNDRFGHEAGDNVLRETVQLLRSVIRRGDHVFRVGGDEFVVVFADRSGPRTRGSQPPDSIEKIAERFQQQVGNLRLPQIGVDAKETLSISAGLVTYPWDGRTTRELLTAADELALQSKRSGKNVITFGPKPEEDGGSAPEFD